MNAEFILKRDLLRPERTLGRILANDTEFLGYTCEDADRHLENGGTKIYGETAIPRGRYKLTVDFSVRFQKPMLHILDVPQFEGVRIHGGNTEHDTLGCPLLGRTRTAEGVMNCKEVVDKLIARVKAEEAEGKNCWITVA